MNKGYILLDSVMIIVITIISVLIVTSLVNSKVKFIEVKDSYYEQLDNNRWMMLKEIVVCQEKEVISTSMPLLP